MYPFELDDMVSGLLKGSGTTAKTDKNIAAPGKPAPTRVSMGRYIQHVRYENVWVGQYRVFRNDEKTNS